MDEIDFNLSQKDRNFSSSQILSTEPEAYIVPVIFAAIFIIGVIGNNLVIVSVLCNREMQTPSNILILSLAVGDLLLLIVSVPLNSTIYTFREWPFGNVVCKLVFFLQTLSVGVSVFTLVALSGDRFISIVFPGRKLISTSCEPHKISGAIAGSIWLLAIALAVMDLVGAHMDTSVLDFCTPFPAEWGSWYPKFRTMFQFIMYFLFPVIIIAVFYISVARVLWQSSQRMMRYSTTTSRAGSITSTGLHTIDHRRKVALLVLCFIVMYIICWLPRHIYLIIANFTSNFHFNVYWNAFKITGFCLCFINSCVNPIALYLISGLFQAHFKYYLTKCFCSCRPKDNRESLDGVDVPVTEDVSAV